MGAGRASEDAPSDLHLYFSLQKVPGLLRFLLYVGRWSGKAGQYIIFRLYTLRFSVTLATLKQSGPSFRAGEGN